MFPTDVLTKFTCNGKAVAELVEQEESKKRDATSQWKTITTTVTPFAITVVVVLGIYIAREHLRVNRALYRREWKVPYEEIELVSVDTLRKTNLFKSSSVFTQSGDNGSRWAAGRVKVGIYQVCCCCCFCCCCCCSSSSPSPSAVLLVRCSNRRATASNKDMSEWL